MEKIVMITDSCDDVVTHRLVMTRCPANSAFIEATIQDHVVILITAESLFRLLREFLHHAHPAVVTERILKHTLAVLVGLGNLKASLEIRQTFTATGANPKGALFVFRIQLPGDGLGLGFVFQVMRHDRQAASVKRNKAWRTGV